MKDTNVRQVGEEGKNILLERFLITSFFFGHNGFTALKKISGCALRGHVLLPRFPLSQIPGPGFQRTRKLGQRGEIGKGSGGQDS